MAWPTLRFLDWPELREHVALLFELVIGTRIRAYGGIGLAPGFTEYASAFFGFAAVILIGMFAPKLSGEEDEET